MLFRSRIAHLARYDGITGLPNRNLLRDRLDQALPLAKRDSRQVAVLIADLDGFKLINDTLGHQSGDRLLAAVGKRIRPVLRASDTVARVSGDEFVIMLPDLAQPDAAATVAQKVLDVLSTPFLVDGHEAFLTASIGIALSGSAVVAPRAVLAPDTLRAALAKLLKAPVVLVVDAMGITRGVAPLVLGTQAFDRAVAIEGDGRRLVAAALEATTEALLGRILKASDAAVLLLTRERAQAARLNADRVGPVAIPIRSPRDRKSTRLNSSHMSESRMPSSA